jgi:pimeloyl-ACP methyl ester carboxylesterase
VRSLSVSSGGAELHVVEDGDAGAPTLVFVHGYPDTHRCWDELVELLSERFHTVSYDVRGMGRSTAARGGVANPSVPAREYALEILALDLAAVMDAVSPERPVHLVGHDWGSFQCWEAVTTEWSSGRIASHTAIAGPRIDKMRGWARRRLRPSRSSLAELADQLRRSWYVAAFQIPRVPDRVVGPILSRAWEPSLRRREGIEPREGHPASTLASDATAGLALYRSNMRPLLSRTERAPAQVPVQLIVAERDRYISPRLFDDAAGWSRRVWRRDLDAGHWVQRARPCEVAAFVTEFVDYVDRRVEESEGLRAARVV